MWKKNPYQGEFMIKMIMLDLDGTLLDPKRKITKANKRILEQVHAQNIPVAICTGRNVRMTMKVVKKLPIPVYYCCVGGVEIFDPTDKPIFQENLGLDEIQEIIDLVKDENCFFQVTNRIGYYKYLLNADCKQYELFGSNSIKHRISNKIVNIVNVTSLESFKDNSFDQSQEIILAGDKALLERLKATIEEKNESLQARLDLWPNYLFITKKGLNKGNSAKVLANHFQIDVSEILAIGDDFNDLDMLETVGYGIAMADAIDSLKEIAYDHTLSNKESGVAHALKHYIIDKKTTKLTEV